MASSPVSCSDQWTDLRARRLVSIPRLHRLLSPLRPSHSLSPCPILFLMPHSLVSLLCPCPAPPCLPLFPGLFSNYNSSFSLFVSCSVFPRLIYSQTFFPFSSFLCLLVSHHLPFISQSPTISHVYLYHFFSLPLHSLSQSQRPRAHSSGLSHI